jgi:UDP-N-acetylglucosamine 2-epimerase (non-hydrolysing)
MHVLSVVGARPQFVKAFAVSRVLREEHRETLLHTGQHYDTELSDVFFDELGIPEPAYNLGVGSSDHATQTAAMLTGIDDVIETEDPDALLLYGDTNSTLAGAIAGAKRDLCVAHVEAGLRSDNRSMPEETNRVLTDHASDLLFAPSETAVANLTAEGITAHVHRSGDVMYDAIRWARSVAADESSIREDLGLVDEPYVLATVHRASNTDDEDRLRSIIEALGAVDLPVVFPIHPRTESRLRAAGLWAAAAEQLQVIDPVGYFDFVQLLDGASRVATDSGGVQKEAFFLDTFCVTLRDETEWVETVEAGWNVLVGADRNAITSALSEPVTLPDSKPEPYGDGNAAAEISATLGDWPRGGD